jgi:hypothetical protein
MNRSDTFLNPLRDLRHGPDYGNVSGAFVMKNRLDKAIWTTALLTIALLIGFAAGTVEKVARFDTAILGSTLYFSSNTNLQLSVSGSVLQLTDAMDTTPSIKLRNSDGATAFMALTAGDDFAITPSSTGAVKVNGGVNAIGSYTSGDPSGGTAAAWKFGNVVTGATVTLVTTNYIQTDIGGVAYKLAIVH